MTHKKSTKTKFILNFSSPIAGRPEVFWATGSTDKIIIELWPVGHGKTIGQKRKIRRADFDVPEKYVAYERNKPNIRCVVNIDSRETYLRQIARGGRLEWEGQITTTELRGGASLLREIITVYKKGRPRKDDLVEEARQLRAEGFSWRKTSEHLNEKYDLKTNKESIRKLVGSRNRN